ncbi:acylphosphatase [Mucilaginibacter gracilis]|uniref:acylphosphatase n=1 Tax=Mucilaginibacter gracilis TaxID=423350 RepID=A0A495J9K7_9SPHI|nr:acylphosphatase [Mucilaginibacter gracilis]RKR85597.1 acylphosphatase [Mucilaginibacter gracilis]
MAVKHLNITVSGKVQGVSFRASTKAVADQLGVRGFILNQPDGSVYLEAEADDWNMQLFLDWCNEGPQGTVITSLQSDEGEIKNYRNFEIVKRAPQQAL